MNYKDFNKCTSTDNKLKILNMFFKSKEEQEEYSAYDFIPHLDIAYKNIHTILLDFNRIGLIETSQIPRQPPHYAIKYKITSKGKFVLSVLDTIKNI
jgi:DNA-binding HxlR family transcriptional regulator